MKLVDKPLTDMQKKFARYYVEAFFGKEYLSNTGGRPLNLVMLLIVHIKEHTNY